jgi:hypothetical protein
MDQQYQYNNPGTVTYIDDLPDIDDLEAMGQGGYHGHHDSGYGKGHQAYDRAYGRPVQEPNYEQLQNKVRQFQPPPPEAGMSIPEQNVGNQAMPPPRENYTPPPPMMTQNNPSCLAIAEHVKDCPICSKFYNNDNTIYIIVIVVLAIICILLLKRVLDI